jgi:hypothetical protein
MGPGDIIFMVVVVAVAALMTVLKGKVPAWLGFILVLLGGLVCIVGGAATRNFKVIPVGVAFVIATILLWATGATSSPSTNSDDGDGSAGKYPDPDTLGATARNAPWWAWVISTVVVIAGFLVGFLAIPTRA